MHKVTRVHRRQLTYRHCMLQVTPSTCERRASSSLSATLIHNILPCFRLSTRQSR